MSLYVVRNNNGETQKVYSEDSKQAKESVCRCMGWETIECTVRMITDR